MIYICIQKVAGPKEMGFPEFQDLRSCHSSAVALFDALRSIHVRPKIRPATNMKVFNKR